ncbi:MAG: 30S ribosomal protein S6 [Patescibacteria group bacterium]
MDKKDYELSYLLISPEAEAEVLKLLAQTGAEVVSKKEPAVLQLSYLIKKQQSAHFGYVQFKGVPSELKSLRESLRLNAAVLRFLLVSYTPIKRERMPIQDLSAAAPKPTQNEPAPRPIIPQSEGPLTNEALEKTLEQILK